jgi:integrase
MNNKFNSHRKFLLEEFITYQRALNFKFKNIYTYNQLDSFFLEMNKTESMGVTKEECEQWSIKRTTEKISTQYGRISKLNNFCIFLQRKGLKTSFPYQVKNKISFTPYIYSSSEIIKLFESCEKLALDKPRSCRHIFPTYFKLLYATGIRKNEGLHLAISDVDLVNGTILIREPKNGKDRLLPLSNSLKQQMFNFSNRYNKFSGKNELFFRTLENNKPVNEKSLTVWFVKILKEADIPYLGGGKGPRIHDLRYVFATQALINMIKKGMDIYCCIPILSQYLGHSSIEATEHYVYLIKEIYPNIIKAKQMQTFDFLSKGVFDEK